MTEPQAPSVDIAELVDVAHREAAARELVVVPAVILGDDAVIMTFPEVSVGVALDLAVRSGAPFVTIDAERFDSAEILQSLGDDRPIPNRLRSAFTSREGEYQELWIRWVSMGSAYAFLAVPAWHSELLAEVEAWREGSEEAEREEFEASRARISDFVAAALQSSDVRIARPSHRKGVVERAIRNSVSCEIDARELDIAIRQAVHRVREANNFEYASVEASVPEVMAEYMASNGGDFPRWTSVEKRQSIREFLVEKTGGYAPTETLVKRIYDEIDVR